MEEATPTPEPIGPSLAELLVLRQGIGAIPSDLWVDELHHRLYVLCPGELDIVDTTSNRVRRVNIPRGATILAVDVERRQVLVGGSGNTGPSELLVLDGETGATVRSILLPAAPWRTLYLADRGLAVIALSPGRIAAVRIDTGELALVDAGGVQPIFAADADAGKVYMSGGVSASGEIVEDALSALDLQSGEVDIVPLPARPTAFALHPRLHRLFALHQYAGEVSIYTPSGGVESTVEVGGELTEIALDVSGNRVYVVDWSGGRVVVLEAESLRTAGEIEIPSGSRFLYTDIVGQRLLLTRPESSQITHIFRERASHTDLLEPVGDLVVHPATRALYATIPEANLLLGLAANGDEFVRWTLPGRPEEVVLDAALGKLFVSIPASNSVAVIDLATRAQEIIPPALQPSAALLNPGDRLLYLTDARSDTVFMFSPERGVLVRAVSVGPQAKDLILNHATGETLVACADGLYGIMPGAAKSERIASANARPLIAVNASTNRIYLGQPGARSGLRALDGSSHSLLRTLDIPGDLLHLEVDEKNGRILLLWRPVESPDALMISLLEGQTLEERRVSVAISLPRGEPSVARWDASHNRLAIAFGEDPSQLALVDTSTEEVQVVEQFHKPSRVPTGTAPFSLACDRTLGKVYLGRYGSDALLLVDSQSAVSTTVRLSGGVTALALDSARARVYAALADGSLAVLDGRTAEVVGTVMLNGAASLLVADPQHERVFAADQMAAIVQIVRDPTLIAEARTTPTPAPSATVQAPISPWRTYANGDQVRILTTDGTYVWAGTADGGIVRWSADGSRFQQFLAPQDGLRSNEILGLAVRRAGDLWAATNRGLSHYDGRTWTTVLADASGLPDDKIHAVAVGRAGNIWMGTESGGLGIFDGRQWLLFSPRQLGLEGTWITEIAFDQKGQAWLGSWLGVSVLGQTDVFTYTAQNSGLSSGVVSALLALEDGTIWAGADGGVSYYQSGAWTGFAPESGAPDHVWALAQTSNGDIWAASDSGIHRFDGERWENVGTVRAAAEAYAAQWQKISARSQRWPIVYAGGRIWAILHSGLADFDGQVWTRHSTTGGAPPANRARVVATGPDGALWAGFAGAGAAKYDGQTWTSIAGTDQVGLNVNAILLDSSDRLWFAADEGISQLSGERWTLYRAGENGLLNARALGLAWDPAGTLWVATEQGVSAFQRDRWISFTTANSNLSNNRILGCAVDSDSSVWCATSGGVAHYDGQQWEMFTNPEAPATEQEIRGVALDGNGHRWFGARQTLRRLSGTNWFNYRDLREAVEYDYARILNTLNNPNRLWAVDRAKGRIWVTTEDGVAAYNGQTWEFYTPDNSGLVSGTVLSIVVDSDGAVWFATDQGISRLSP